MSIVSRLVEVHPGEGERVALTVSVGFVAAAGLMIGGSAIEAIFFAEVGADRLPTLYLILGVTMFCATLGFSASLARLGRARACLAIPLVLSALAVAGRIALLAGPSIAPALWLLQAVAQFLVGLTVWGLAGIVTDTRQAKRFFPLIAAGSVLGYVLGGLATKPLAALMGTPNLLLVWTASLLAVVAVGARVVSIGDGWTFRRSARDPGPADALRRGLRYVRTAPVMRWMALGALLFSVLFFSLYLPFSSAAAERYPDPDELAGFFGTFFGLSTGLAFLLSLVVINRLLGRFGVPMVLLVLPVLYVVSFGVLTVAATFPALMVARFAQVAWLQGGAVSSIEAVINTAPADRRDQTRAFLYGGPTQLGTVLAGVIAIAGRSASDTFGYAIALVAAVAATVAMLGVRRGYARELVRALREGRPSVFERGPDAADPLGLARDDRATVEAVTGAVSSTDPRLRRIGAHVIADVATPRRTQLLERALADDDADVRATAIASVARSAATETLPQVVARLGDDDPRVRVAAVRCVGALASDAAEATHDLAAITADPEPLVRTEADGVLAAIGSDAEASDRLLGSTRSPEAAVRAAAFRGLRGSDDPRAVEAAFAGLADVDPAVRSAAAQALPDSTEVGDRLVATLRDPARREGALSSLRERSTIDRAPAIRDAAIEIMHRAVDRHDQALAFARTDDARAKLLGDSLESLADREARDAIRVAASLGHGSELGVALDNLSITDPGRRANALEVLESVGDRSIVGPLIAVWEGGHDRAGRASTTIATLTDDTDPWISACATFAGDADGGTMDETATTLSPMDRVLFLREVPLFASLPPADLLPIATIAQERSFVDGDRLASRGDPGDEMYIVVSGSVAVTTGGADAAQIATRGEGEAIGEMALLTGHPRVADLSATGDVRALAIARPEFEAILRERPDTALAVIRALCERLEESSAAAASV